MSNPYKVNGALLLIVAVIGGYLVHSSMFYPTGAHYYDACWMRRTKTNAGGEARASDPYQDILWSNCEAIARRAMFDVGMLFAGEPESDKDTSAVALKDACPDNWKALSGLYSTALDEVQSSGGPNLADRVTPAEWMVSRVLQARWPKCDVVRRQQGYPKIVEVKPGEFDWGEPCTPCAARDRQKEEKKKAAAQEDWETEKKRWEIVKPTQVEVREAEVSPIREGEYRISGSIKNRAAVNVSAIKFNVVAYDCPMKATPVAACDVIGKASKTTYVDLPAGQVGALWQVFSVPNLPKPRGLLSWSFYVEGIRAPLNADDALLDRYFGPEMPAR